MLPDLERLIRLQQLETAVAAARQTIESFPAARDGLEARLARHTAGLEAAERRLAANKAARRELEKETAAIREEAGNLQRPLDGGQDQQGALGRSSRNRARDHGHPGARRADTREDDGKADELSSDIEAARQALAEERTTVGEEQRRLEQERDRLQAQVERYDGDREEIVSGLSPGLIETFDTLMRGRKGIAVSEVRDGRCRSCQVRLRPQLYNDVRLNQRLIQCESCQRFLYFPTAAGDAAAPPA